MTPLLLLALLLAAAPGDPPAEASPVATEVPDRDWAALDARLAALEGGPAGALRWGALVRAFGTWSGAESTGTEDAAGFVLEDVDLHLVGGGQALSWRLSVDAGGDGRAALEDAHARWRPADGWELVVGQFKPRVARSASIAPEGLLFRDRTFLGAAFDLWDVGLELGRHYDQFDLWLAYANAEDGPSSDEFWSVRGEWALYDAAFDDVDGARGAPNHLRVLLGAFVSDDTALSSDAGGALGLDLAFTLGPWAFLSEWARLGEDFVRDVDVRDGAPVTLGDGSPWAVMLSRRHGAFESAARLESAGDANDTSAWALSSSWERSGGRWSLEFERLQTDTGDDTRLSLGVQLGASGLHRPLGLGAASEPSRSLDGMP